MELKVVCLCGQKYKFDVEPVNSQMPFPVTCPVCGHDGTKLANALLMQVPAAPPIIAVPAPTAVATAAAVPSGLRLNRTAEPPMPPPVPVGTSTSAPVTIAAAPPPRRPVHATATGPARNVPKYLQDNKAIMNNSFLMGVLGAILGAILDIAVMVGLRIFCGYIFVMFGMMLATALGVIMGCVIGGGARVLYRGTDFALGAICAGIAFFTIGITFLLTFGLIGLGFSIMALLIGTAAAFKIAS